MRSQLGPFLPQAAGRATEHVDYSRRDRIHTASRFSWTLMDFRSSSKLLHLKWPCEKPVSSRADKNFANIGRPCLCFVAESKELGHMSVNSPAEFHHKARVSEWNTIGTPQMPGARAHTGFSSKDPTTIKMRRAESLRCIGVAR